MKQLLAFCTCVKFGNEKTVQNRLVYHLRDYDYQQKQLFLYEKLPDARDIKQRKHNRTEQIRSVATKFATAQLDTF